MTTDSRALIEEARSCLESMGESSWAGSDDRIADLAVRLVKAGPKAAHVSASECHEITEAVLTAYSGEWPLAVAWLQQNLAALLTGYSAALDEVERQVAAREQDTREALIENGQLRERLVASRTSIGDLKLVLEQQDRDLTASRAINRHFEQERDSWGEAYKQRAAKTDKRIAELEAELRRWESPCQPVESEPRGWICPTCKDPNCGVCIEIQSKETHARRRSESDDRNHGQVPPQDVG